MPTIPDDLRQRLTQYGQDHVLRDWDRLTAQEQQTLLEHLQRVDVQRLRELHGQQGRTYPVPAADQVEPVPVLPRLSADNASYRQRGEAALRAGQVAAL